MKYKYKWNITVQDFDENLIWVLVQGSKKGLRVLFQFYKVSADSPYLFMYMAWFTMAQFISTARRYGITCCDGLHLLARMGLLTVWRVDDLRLLDDVMMALNLRTAFLKHTWQKSHREEKLLIKNTPTETIFKIWMYSFRR